MGSYNNVYPIDLILLLGGIFTLLSICLAFFSWRKKNRPSALSKELFLRTRSWTYIVLSLSVVILAPTSIGTLLLAYLSFIAFREMISISGFRAADRTALLVAYAAIPVQYYFAYTQQLNLFFFFLPIGMAVLIPFILIGTGKTAAIGRSMALIPSILLLTVFMLSYLALLLNNDSLGKPTGALLLFVLLTTGLNDVFQFVWGKSFGKRKIIPAISPNKTWEGFIGGIITTACLAYLLRFLTPLTGQQVLLTGLGIGIAGFAGDILISAIKRDLKLKDTGDTIPGHGGIMDRLDSLVLTAPVFYYLLQFFFEQQWMA